MTEFLNAAVVMLIPDFLQLLKLLHLFFKILVKQCRPFLEWSKMIKIFGGAFWQMLTF